MFLLSLDAAFVEAEQHFHSRYSEKTPMHMSSKSYAAIYDFRIVCKRLSHVLFPWGKQGFNPCLLGDEHPANITN